MEKRGRTIAYIRPRVEGMDRDEQLGEHAPDEVFTEAPDARTFEAQVKLHECLDSLQEGDTLLVESMSCLARNFRDFHHIAYWVRNKGAAIIFVQEDIYFNTSPGPTKQEQYLPLPIVEAYATFNRELIKERKLEAFAKAKAEGRHIGRPAKLSKEQRSEIRARLESGDKITLLAKDFMVSVSTIYDIKAGR